MRHLLLALVLLSTAAHADSVPVLPVQQSDQDVTVMYVTGGVGLAERDYLDTVKKDYSLKVEAALSNGEFIAEVVATIAHEGQTVLSTELDGPQLLVQLPAGSYKVELRYGEESKTQTVSIPKGGRRDLMFVFKPQAEPEAPKTSLPPLRF